MLEVHTQVRGHDLQEDHYQLRIPVDVAVVECIAVRRLGVECLLSRVLQSEVKELFYLVLSAFVEVVTEVLKELLHNLAKDEPFVENGASLCLILWIFVVLGRVFFQVVL